MKKVITIICTVLVGTSLITGCKRTDVGLVSGGVIGAAAGNALTGGSGVGTAVGAVGGAYAGHELAR